MATVARADQSFMGGHDGRRAAISLGIAVAPTLAAVSIAPNREAPDFLQGLMLLALPPIAATGAGCAAWWSFATRSATRTLTTLAVTGVSALGVWSLVVVLWLGHCSS
jgi:hypothetical protein